MYRQTIWDLFFFASWRLRVRPTDFHAQSKGPSGGEKLPAWQPSDKLFLGRRQTIEAYCLTVLDHRPQSCQMESISGLLSEKSIVKLFSSDVGFQGAMTEYEKKNSFRLGDRVEKNPATWCPNT
ncbi:MAG: hypothetical protein ACKN9U_23605, partial [Pirellulaceae bacterium]